QAYKVGDKLVFWGGLITEAIGGGAGLSDSLIELAQRKGVRVQYDSKAVRLHMDGSGRVTSLTARVGEAFQEMSARAIVLACGGFEANPEWRTRYLGPNWDLARVRGTRHNTGEGIKMALDIGAQPYGHWSSCHAVQWDMNAPPFGDRKDRKSVV